MIKLTCRVSRHNIEAKPNIKPVQPSKILMSLAVEFGEIIYLSVCLHRGKSVENLVDLSGGTYIMSVGVGGLERSRHVLLMLRRVLFRRPSNASQLRVTIEDGLCSRTNDNRRGRKHKLAGTPQELMGLSMSHCMILLRSGCHWLQHNPLELPYGIF